MEKQISGEEYRQMSVSSRAPKNVHKRTVTIPAIWIAVVIVVGGLSFYGGVHYEKHHLPASKTAAASSAFGKGFGGAGRANGLRAIGTVSSVSGSSITVENARTSSSSTYTITSSTKITDNGQTVSASDIQTGDTVMITKASSSSSDATAIEVNPSFGGGFGGGVSAPSTDSTSPSSDSSSDSTSN